MKMYKAEIQGLGQNEFVQAGVWLTEEELNEVVERQYDESKNDKIMRAGGRFFRPKDFRGVIEEKTLKELAESGSPLFDSKLIESLAKAGYLSEVKKVCPSGYRTFVDKLVESGKYRLDSGEQRKEIGEKENPEGLARLEEMKRKRLG